MDTPNFEGAHNHDRHRTVGPHRAWCHNCREWCYPDGWCACCHEAAGHVWMDPLRVSVEAITEIIDGANDAYNDGRAESYDLDSPIHPKIQVMAAAVVAWINGETP